MMGEGFQSVDLSLAESWFNAMQAGELVTVAQHNSGVANLLVMCDVLADPRRVMKNFIGVADGSPRSLELPAVPYAGPDSHLIGTNVPLIGAVPVPEHWRTGGAAPADLPAWVRDSDRERRMLYGATRALLEELPVTRVLDAQQGRQSGWVPIAIGVAGGLVMAGVGVLAHRAIDAYFESRSTIETTRIREAERTARYAALLRAKLESAKQRYEVAARTGTLPPPAPIEGAPGSDADAGAGRSPAPGSPEQRSEDWWAMASKGLPWVAGGTVAVALVWGALAWWRKPKSYEDRGGK